MSAATVVNACADGGNIERHGNIAVGGGGSADAGKPGVLFADRNDLASHFLKKCLLHIATAGTDAHRSYGEFRRSTGVCSLNGIFKVLLHDSEAFVVFGAVLVEHLGVLGDGIDRGTALNGTYVVGGLTALFCGDCDAVQVGDEVSKLGNGIGGAEGGEGMSAAGGACNLIAVRAYASGVYVDVSCIKGIELLDAPLAVYGKHAVEGFININALAPCFSSHSLQKAARSSSWFEERG